jgi:hypothetical protein
MTEDTDLSTLSDDQLAAMMGSQAPEHEAPDEPILEAEPEAPETPPEAPKAEAKHVPLAELLEERGRRKEAQARVEEMERRFAEFQARAQEYIAQRSAGEQEKPPANYEEDPIEYLRQQQAQLAASTEALRQHALQSAQQQAAAQQWAAMREAVDRSEKAFAQQAPDYWDAVQHLKSHRQQQLLAQGASEQQAAQVIQQDAVAVAAEAGRLGLSPAEYAYRIAIGTGYAPKARQQAQASSAAHDAPKSLGGASGKSDASAPSLSDITRMTDKEFDKVFAKLMGGT